MAYGSEVQQAVDVLGRWSEHEIRMFAHFMTGYSPGALLQFELSYTRQGAGRDPEHGPAFPTLLSEQLAGREPWPPGAKGDR